MQEPPPSPSTHTELTRDNHDHYQKHHRDALIPVLSQLSDSGSETSDSDKDDSSKLNLDASSSSSSSSLLFSNTNTSSPSQKSLSAHHKRININNQAARVLSKMIRCVLMPLVWPLMCTVPLLLSCSSSPMHYKTLFPSTWYEHHELHQHQSSNQCDNDSSSSRIIHHSRPKPLGLILGILAVAVGQVAIWTLFYLYRTYGHPSSIQSKGAVSYEYAEGVRTHTAQPEGFALLVGYLAVTWHFQLLPSSYYAFHHHESGGGNGIQWKETLACLLVQDLIQFTLHIVEHVASPTFYQRSHKPHHRFTNPRIFDAFNGSTTDTFCMIIVPLFLTAHLVRTVNVWTYMTFGSVYAGWLTLIHSEYAFVWDKPFRIVGLGTPGDHHVHHKFFKYNYGHLFMWWDQCAGTYRHPHAFVPKGFRPNV